MDKDINAPLVSVIMPAYNASAHIQEAINSVIAQTFTDWELIIVDDGSSDNTAMLVKQYLLEDNNIQYYYQENGKQGKARNLAISKSKGEYLAFLDADDLWLPEKLKIQIKEIKEKNVDLIFSNTFVINGFEKVDSKKIIHCHQGFLDFKEGLDRMLEKNRVPILTVLVKKSKVLDVGMFTEEINMHEDSHLWLKLLINKSTFFGSNETLSIYRVHNKSTTANEKFPLKVYINVLSDISYNNKEIIFRILELFIQNHLKVVDQLEKENKKLKNNFIIKTFDKIKKIILSDN